MDFLVYKFGDRLICLKGVGKLFYQDGFPISMAISQLKKEGIEVSMFHVADECMKNGWSGKTTMNRLTTALEDDIDHNIYDLRLLGIFCSASYEEQREMIFKYLFKDDKENALTFIKERTLSSVG